MCYYIRAPRRLSWKMGQCAVPFLFSDAFEEDILHVTIAETAEQTGHDGALRNPLALAVRSGNVTANSQSVY